MERHAAIASSLLYKHRLDNLGRVFAGRNVMPVIVKGQSIADLAYPREEIRLSADVDILVGEDREAIAAILLDVGYREKPLHSRCFAFQERIFYQDDPTLPPLVELHRCLDKILLRPIPYHDIMARARPTQRIGFRYPAIEDLLLLIVLHASSDIYFDAARVERDLHFLADCKDLDMALVNQRAQEWQLATALYRLLNGKYPKLHGSLPATSQLANTFRFFAAQFGWHDSVATVFRGMLYYSYARLCDRLVFWRTDRASS